MQLMRRQPGVQGAQRARSGAQLRSVPRLRVPRPQPARGPAPVLQTAAFDAPQSADWRSTPPGMRTATPPPQQEQQQQQLHQQQQPMHQPEPFQAITGIWAAAAHSWPNQVALQEPHRSPPVSVTYGELHELVLNMGAGLKALGLGAGEAVCLFAESSSRWIQADQGILANAAVDAVRGSSAPADELAYILQHSQAVALVLQDRATLAKLAPAISAQAATRPIKFVALLWDDEPAASSSSSSSSSSAGGSSSYEQAAAQLAGAGVPLLTYAELQAAGSRLRAVGPFEPAQVERSTPATIAYTSGTSGHPKGALLSHGNLAYQVAALPFFLQVSPGDSSLSLLPPWHIYQRTAAYYLFSRGAREVFSSLRHFRDDLAARPPDHFVAVPLVLDTLHSRVSAKLAAEATGAKGAVVRALLAASNAHILARRLLAGVSLAHALRPPSAQQRLAAGLTLALTAPLYALAQRLVFSKVRAALGIRRTIVSGGGSLPAHLDLFFEALGLTVLNGYGLTETSPVLACRTTGANVRGTIGLPTPGTQLRVVDPESHAPLPDGQQGLILAAGPGVMQGYFANPEATAKAFIDGWFDTGDLGWRVPGGVAGSNMAGHFVLSGRAKDTIVLLSGKNIEPQPIEDALCRSPWIKHVVLLGQDKRELGALVFPDEEALAAAGPSDERALQTLLAAEVAVLNTARPDAHPEDHISHIQVIRAPLSVEGGTLTRTMKVRRAQVAAAYAAEVTQLLARLRG